MAEGHVSNVEAATEVIKATYRSWKFTVGGDSRKISVAEATAIALHRAGLLADMEFADIHEIDFPNVGQILKER